MRRLLLPSIVVAAVLGVAPAGAWASCGSDHCPLDAHGMGGLHDRVWLDLSYQFIQQDQVRIGRHDAEVGELPSAEDEVRTTNRITTLVGYGRLTDRLAVSLALPWVDREHEHVSNEPGEEPVRRTWSYSGLGDATAMAQWRALGPNGTPGRGVVLIAGVHAPTGRREVDPVLGEEPEPAARPGNGAWGVTGGLHVMHQPSVPMPSGTRGAATVFATAQLQANGRGTEDYRVGNELGLHTGGEYPLGERLSLLGQLNARVRAKDGVGDTDAERDNTGGTWIYASPGLKWHAGAASIWGLVQLPVYQRVNRIQIVAPYHLMLGVSGSIAPWVGAR